MATSATPFEQRQNYPHVLSGLATLDNNTDTTLPIPCGGRAVVRLGFPTGTDGTTATFLVQPFPPADPATPTADPPFRTLVDRTGATVSITVTDDSLVEIPQLSGCFAFQVVMGTAQSPAADIEVQCVGASPAPFEEADGGVLPTDFATPAFGVGSVAAAGSSGKVVASDATIKMPLTLAGLIPLASARFKRVSNGNSSLATGDNDLYTAPANTRAWVIGAWELYNNSAGNIGITPYVQFQATGTRYPVATVPSPLGAGLSGNIAAGGFVLEPGDVVGVTTTTTNGLNVAFTVIEFPSTVPFKTAWVLNPASGDNTVYTCPAATNAWLCGIATFPAYNGNVLAFVNASGGSLDWYYNVVPSGQSVGAANKMIAAASVAGSPTTRSTNSGGVTAISLNAGDFVSANLSGANTGGLLWATVAELAGA